MLEEQILILNDFRRTYGGSKDKQIVIYGTGISAKAVLTECEDYPIIGVMDLAKTGEMFCGFKVLSQEEIESEKDVIIVIVARPAVHTIIYKRISDWCEKKEIPVLDVCGNCVGDSVKVQHFRSAYFDVDYEQLQQEIKKHEVISFDIFDTLLTRDVYEPTDVFHMMEKQSGVNGFAQRRIDAEIALQYKTEPNIYQIYDNLWENEQLLALELATEKKLLRPRIRMVECLAECISLGKKVYLISDMYWPKEIMEGILAENGISGYEELLVSCDYGKNKVNGLFEELKHKIGDGITCLHIGDNREVDYNGARAAGVDAFFIMAPVRMMEISSYCEMLLDMNGLEKHILIGMIAARSFNDPFALYHSNGYPWMDNEKELGYRIIAPFAVCFVLWLIQQVRGEKESLLLFSSRDGWIVQQLYQRLIAEFQLSDLPEDIYFLTSRRVLQDIDKNYQDYLNRFDWKRVPKIYFFDFMSRGTCQTLLEKQIGRSFIGLYVQKSISENREKNQIEVHPYYKEDHTYGNTKRIFALNDFLECIFTTENPSIIAFDADGKPVFDQERRKPEQIHALKMIQQGILDFGNRFAEIAGSMPEQVPSSEYADHFLKFTSRSYTNVNLPGVEEFVLDDWLGGDKNTGHDAFL